MTEPALPGPLSAGEPLTLTAAATYALLTVGELSVWVRETLDPADDFAQTIINSASLVVVETAGHPEWTRDTAPARARLIAAQLAKRTYLNPDAVVRSNVGPLGEATVEDFARTLELTAAERAELIALRPEGDPSAGSLFVVNLGGPVVVESDTIYLSDSAGTLLAYHDPNDVGAP